MIDCRDLATKLGFRCHQVTDGLLNISTPYAFSDGEVVNFLLRDVGGTIIITDNCDFIAHFMSLGMDLSDKRKWIGIKNIVSNYNFNLTERGEIQAITTMAKLADRFNAFSAIVHDLTKWEIERLTISEEISDLVDQIEYHIRRRNEGIGIERGYRATGATGHKYIFDMKVDDTLIEGIEPNGHATGAALRKVLDVERGAEDLGVVLVMDDRANIEAAKDEAMILSSVCSVITFSTLAEGIEPISFERWWRGGNSLQ